MATLTPSSSDQLLSSPSSPSSPTSSPLPLRSALKHSYGSRPPSPHFHSGSLSPPSHIPKHDSLVTPRSELLGLPQPSIATLGYTPKVSFDTFENPAASMFSFTLQVKSEGYQRTRNTRVFLCASSPDESGSEALDWSLESLVQDGDELVVFRGVDEEQLGSLRSCCMLEDDPACTNSDPLEKDHDVLREEARELMRKIQDHSAEVDANRKVRSFRNFKK